MRLNPNLGERQALDRVLKDESDPYVAKAMQLKMADPKAYSIGGAEGIAWIIDTADQLRQASQESRGGGSGTSTNWQDYR